MARVQATTLSEEHERELRKIFDDYDQVGGLVGLLFSQARA